MNPDQEYLLNSLNESIKSRPLHSYGPYQRELLHTLSAYVLKRDLNKEEQPDEKETCKCSPDMQKFFEGLLNLKEIIRCTINQGEKAEFEDSRCSDYYLNNLKIIYHMMNSIIKEKE